MPNCLRNNRPTAEGDKAMRGLTLRRARMASEGDFDVYRHDAEIRHFSGAVCPALNSHLPLLLPPCPLLSLPGLGLEPLRGLKGRLHGPTFSSWRHGSAPPLACRWQRWGSIYPRRRASLSGGLSHPLVPCRSRRDICDRGRVLELPSGDRHGHVHGPSRDRRRGINGGGASILATLHDAYSPARGKFSRRLAGPVGHASRRHGIRGTCARVCRLYAGERYVDPLLLLRCLRDYSP